MEHGSLDDLWQAAKVAGPFANMLLLVLWFLERKDRVRLQTERDALLERVINGMHAATTSIDSIRQLFAGSARWGRRDRDGADDI